MWLADHMHAAPHTERSCVKGQPEAVDRVPRAGGWSDRTSCGDKAPLSVSVHAAAEPSRFVTYDNATVGAAAVRQLHRRALPPVWYTDTKPHVCKHMFIILSSRIRIRVRIRGFCKNPSESVRLQDFEIRNNTTDR